MRRDRAKFERVPFNPDFRCLNCVIEQFSASIAGFESRTLKLLSSPVVNPIFGQYLHLGRALSSSSPYLELAQQHLLPTVSSQFG